ncbi:MAG TPA: LysM peptidoglycan-binding domain-containing protein, partial [Clostridia bacterium]|nr:LysM peptidoglycan-binding domain-containing protein [Clostridia bacterium]
ALSLGGRALESTPVAVVTGIQGVEDLQVRPVTVQLMQHNGHAASTAMLREEFDLPASLGVQETLFARARPIVRQISGGEGRTMVEGDVILDVYHASALPDKPLVITRHTLPFEQAVEVGAASEDGFQARVALKDVAVSSVDAGEGGRLLRTETVLNVEGIVNRPTTLETLADVYTLGGEMIALEHEPLTILATETIAQSAQSEKLLFELPEGAQPVRSVLAAFIQPVLAATHPLGERQQVEGVLQVTVVYLPFGGEAPVSASQDLPFHTLFPGALPEGAWLRMDAQEVDAAAITADRVELQYKLCLDADACSLASTVLPTGAFAQDAPAVRSGLVLAYPQKGETLWDLARRYRVTAESIERANPTLKTPQPGQAVVVFQRAK